MHPSSKVFAGDWIEDFNKPCQHGSKCGMGRKTEIGSSPPAIFHYALTDQYKSAYVVWMTTGSPLSLVHMWM